MSKILLFDFEIFIGGFPGKCAGCHYGSDFLKDSDVLQPSCTGCLLCRCCAGGLGG